MTDPEVINALAQFARCFELLQEEGPAGPRVQAALDASRVCIASLESKNKPS